MQLHKKIMHNATATLPSIGEGSQTKVNFGPLHAEVSIYMLISVSDVFICPVTCLAH